MSHDELVAAGAELPHHDRLQQTDLGNRGGELLERVFVEGQARLAGVGCDRVDRHLFEIGAVDRAEPGVAVTRRTPSRGIDRVVRGSDSDRALRVGGVNRSD
jgi:hypothetical protein